MDAVCKTCQGDLTGTPVTTLVIIKRIIKEAEEYCSGTILEPAKGEIY